MNETMSIKDASVWASDLLGKEVTPSNIAYLIQYGRIPAIRNGGGVLVSTSKLTDYYVAHHDTKEQRWKKQLGNDLNWKLSFSECKESETTKHVHRLHPYKGKFIPQLVEYFLDGHTDHFKPRAFFKQNDIVLDPFCGSGTTLVQANELNLHAIGVDVSAFNALISNVKLGRYDLGTVRKISSDITQSLIAFQNTKNNVEFEAKLAKKLKRFNDQFFPSPDFKCKARTGEIEEQTYGAKKSAEFLLTYHDLVTEYNIPLLQDKHENFLDKWFLKMVRDEINLVYQQIKVIDDAPTKKILALILSRTIRSCRATTHADLGTLKDPVAATYYCKKHGKICKPLFSILSWWKRYAEDTVKRVEQFDRLRTDTLQGCLVGDSRTIDIIAKLKKRQPRLAAMVKGKKIDGIFSSPPYVGLIDYHEQHAYSYDLFEFDRNDDLEIGPLCKGQGIAARESYVQGVSAVLVNSKQFLKDDCDVFMVANDKYQLYEKIVSLSGMKIVDQYKRPVLNRVEKDRSAYAEIIFHLKKQ